MTIFILHPPSVKTSWERGRERGKRKRDNERKREKRRKKERKRNNMKVKTQTEGNLTACLIKIMPMT
jgi:hypothetical protein